MINRTKLILADIFLLAATIALVLTCFLCDPNSGWRLFTGALFLAASVAYILSRRCPCCGKLGVTGNPFTKKAGRCRRCGKEVEYSDV